MMANFDPPDSHWAADFDARLTGSLYHLLDRLIAAEARIAELESKDRGRDAALAQAVADMKFYANGRIA